MVAFRSIDVLIERSEVRCIRTMKPLKAKAKTKKNNTKFARVKFTTKDNVNVPDPDFTNLRKPVDISVSSLCQVTKLLENGSDEVKAVLAYECNIIYECRICHSLYRSLVNFISHKRVYCKDKFNVTMNRNLSNDYETVFDKDRLSCVKQQDETLFKDSNSNDRILRSHTPGDDNRKDLTAVIDMLQKKQQKCYTAKGKNLTIPNGTAIGTTDRGQLCFESVDTNKSAVYQTSIDSTTDIAPDLIKAQILEIESMKKLETITLEKDKQLLSSSQPEKSDSPLQAYGCDEESELVANIVATKSLTCSICNALFATKKTLAVHVKTLHTSHRMCYPCPCCPSLFANTWSVYRHLFKVHRKSNEQVRKLRSQIQEKAFRKETSSDDDLQKRTHINNYARNMLRVNETQEWMDHLESDSELQRCGGCGKRFDRKAALSSHSQYCQRRIAAWNDSNINNNLKKSSRAPEELIINNNVKGVVNAPTVMKAGTMIPEPSIAVPEVNRMNEISIRVQAVSTLSKADWDKIDSGQPLSSNLSEIDVVSISANNESTDNTTHNSTNRRTDSSPTSDTSDTPEIIFTKLDRPSVSSSTNVIMAHPESQSIPLNGGSKRRKLVSGRRISPTIEISEKSDDSPLEPVPKTNSTPSANSRITSIENKNDEPVEMDDRISRLTQMKSTVNKKDHSAVMEDKIAAIANLRKLQCVPCKRKFTSMTNLRRHIAIHIGWNRYCCKLCNFKCFVKCDCVAHCNKMHNAQNNRALITNMVMEIPPAQYTCNEEIIMDITNLEECVPERKKQSKSYREAEEQTNAPAVVASETTSENSTSTVNAENVTTNVSNEEEILKGDLGGITENVESDISSAKSQKLNVQYNDAEEDTSQDCTFSGTTNSQLGRLESDADLRRMVMEVIFGSTEVAPEKSTKEKCTNSGNNNISAEKRSSESGDNHMISSGSEDSKEHSVSSVEDELKPQRPIRNRIKPVNKDFIYDLKEVAFRKESVTLKATTLTADKVLMRKPYVRLENNECNINFRNNNPLKDHKTIESVSSLELYDSDGTEDDCDGCNTSPKSSFICRK